MFFPGAFQTTLNSSTTTSGGDSPTNNLSMPPPSYVKDITPPKALTAVAAQGFAVGAMRVCSHVPSRTCLTEMN